MMGSQPGLAWNIPNTTIGWIVYITSKLLVAIINILIFHCFVLQGKANIRENQNFIKANEILSQIDDKETEESQPKSPAEWHRGVYGKKATTLFITSALGSVGLTQAILTFDIQSFITYAVTILFGIIFGILAMNNEEIYWTVDYLNYAKRQERLYNDKNERNRTPELGRAGPEE